VLTVFPPQLNAYFNCMNGAKTVHPVTFTPLGW
jgi:hypothetical protein